MKKSLVWIVIFLLGAITGFFANKVMPQSARTSIAPGNKSERLTVVDLPGGGIVTVNRHAEGEVYDYGIYLPQYLSSYVTTTQDGVKRAVVGRYPEGTSKGDQMPGQDCVLFIDNDCDGLPDIKYDMTSRVDKKWIITPTLTKE